MGSRWPARATVVPTQPAKPASAGRLPPAEMKPEIRDVDGRSDERALSRIAQDAADQEAGDERPIQSEEGQAEEPGAVGQVVAEGDQRSLPGRYGDLARVDRAARAGAQNGGRHRQGSERQQHQAGGDRRELPEHGSPLRADRATTAHVPESSERNDTGRSSATIWISTRVPRLSSSRSSASLLRANGDRLVKALPARPGPQPTQVHDLDGNACLTERQHRAGRTGQDE